MSAPRCIYVTSGWGVHDERWVAALETCGFTPTALSLGRDAATIDELRTAVESAAGGTTPVLAGPLGTITRGLLGISAPLIGLSWGYDLHELQEAGDTNWLTELDGLIVDSAATQAIAEQAGVDSESLTRLPWGVDIDVFTPEGERADVTQFGAPSGAPVVFTARAHEPLYRVMDVIEGFAQVVSSNPGAHLLVANQGSLTQALRTRAHELGIGDRVHVIGRVDESQLPALLRSCSVYVTAASVDGTSVTLLQAMACGIPVVASDSAGNREWIEDGVTGRLFTTGDPNELVKSIQQALASTGPRLTEAGRARVQSEADWHANLPRLMTALTRVCTPH